MFSVHIINEDSSFILKCAGYAIADVNYGGSTGYGREYRNRLRGSWGVVDVDDVSNAAKYLAEQGLADPKRLCISGGSAGGYTTLAALAFRYALVSHSRTRFYWITRLISCWAHA